MISPINNNQEEPYNDGPIMMKKTTLLSIVASSAYCFADYHSDS